MLLLSRFSIRLGASDCSPGLAFCFMSPWTFAWICCPQLPYGTTCAKTGRTAHVFAAQGGTRRKRVSKAMGFKMASSGDYCQNSQFWCTSNFGGRSGGSLAPKRVSKPTVFKINGEFWGTFKTRNFGAPAILVPVWVISSDFKSQ